MSSIYHLLIPNSKMSFTMQMEIKLSLISCLPKSLASWREPHITTNTNSGPLLRWTDAIDMSKLQHHCTLPSLHWLFHHCIDSSIIVSTLPFHWHHHSSRLVIDMIPPVTRGLKLTLRNVEQTYIETSFTILPQPFTRSRGVWGETTLSCITIFAYCKL